MGVCHSVRLEEGTVVTFPRTNSKQFSPHPEKRNSVQSKPKEGEVERKGEGEGEHSDNEENESISDEEASTEPPREEDLEEEQEDKNELFSPRDPSGGEGLHSRKSSNERKAQVEPVEISVPHGTRTVEPYFSEGMPRLNGTFKPYFLHPQAGYTRILLVNQEHSNDVTLWCTTKSEAVVRKIIETNRSPRTTPKRSQVRLSQDEKVLVTAFVEDNTQLMAKLLGSKINPDIVVRPNGSALLHEAAQPGSTIEALQILLECGAKVNKENFHGVTPLFMAAKTNRLDALKMLINAGADLNHGFYNKNRITPLQIAVQEGFIEIAKELIESRCLLNCTNKDDATPLYMATQNGNVELVNLLIKAAADIDKPRDTGATPLVIACQDGRTRVAELLLHSKASIEIPARNKQHPLIISCIQGHLAVVKLLIEHESDAQIIDVAKSVSLKREQLHVYNYLQFFSNSFQGALGMEVLSDVVRLSKPERSDGIYSAQLTIPGVSTRCVCKVAKSDSSGGNLWHEFEVLRNVGPHVNVSSYIGVCFEFKIPETSSVSPALVLPFQDGGSLVSYIKNSGALPDEELVGIAYDMAKGLLHLHENRYIHRDLALRNFLLTSKREGKRCILADFSLARRFETDESSVTDLDGVSDTQTLETQNIDTNVYTIHNNVMLPYKWCSPETLSLQIHDSKSDVWMLGVCFWELVSRAETPFQNINAVDELTSHFWECQKKHKDVMDFTGKRESCSSDLIDIIQECLQFDPIARPSVDKLCEMLRSNLLSERPLVKRRRTLSFNYVPNSTTNCGDLIDATQKRDMELIELLVQKQGVPIDCETHYGWTSLMYAVVLGYREIAEYLLTKNADVEHSDQYRFTPLNLAAKENNLEMFRLLLNHGADIHSMTFPDTSDLARALLVDHNCVAATAMLQMGFNKNADYRGKPLSSAAEQYTDKQCKMALAVYPGGPLGFGATMLIYASFRGHLEIVEALISRGVDSHRKDETGRTALDYARWMGHDDVVAYLTTAKRSTVQKTLFANNELRDKIRVGEFCYHAKLVPSHEEQQNFHQSVICSLGPKITSKQHPPSPSSPSTSETCGFPTNTDSKATDSSEDTEWYELSIFANMHSNQSLVSPLGICINFQTTAKERRHALIFPQFQHSLRSVVSQLNSGGNGLPATELYKTAYRASSCLQSLHFRECIHRNITSANFGINIMGNKNERFTLAPVLTAFRYATKVNDIKPVEIDLVSSAHTFGDNALSSVEYSSNKTDTDVDYKEVPDDYSLWRWCAPETLENFTWSKSTDIYMFGITLWELQVDGTTPSEYIPFYSISDTPSQHLAKLRQNPNLVPLRFSEKCPVPLQQLIQLCCIHRPPIQTVVALLDYLAQNPQCENLPEVRHPSNTSSPKYSPRHSSEEPDVTPPSQHED